MKTEDVMYPWQNTEALKESEASYLLYLELKLADPLEIIKLSYNKKKFDPFLKNIYNLHCTGESKSPGVVGKHAV